MLVHCMLPCGGVAWLASVVAAGEGGAPGGNSSSSAQKEFSMEEDFPALPSGTTGSSGPNNSLMTGGAGAPGMMEQFQRMKLDMGGQQDMASGQEGRGAPDRFGMLGLMGVIRMMDENLTTLALGTDLTTLGLNLNASDNLYETFQADARSNRTPDYNLPRYLSPQT
ncbi:hypothetical protein T484DRAFT_1840503 [Baffinella frigidus]|nr:hypothetical protein T484DRAFT_1840503 [Cryptophyta sp. CCMP2293]